MAGNSIGKFFRITTFGESHGLAIGAIIDGMPPGFPICEKDIQYDLNRRRPGLNNYVSQRNEKDKINILSGIFQGKTTGTSIGILIKNEDSKSEDYRTIKNLFRPNHADYTYQQKYGIRDFQGGGRASARETVIRVAAGSIAKKYLFSQCKIMIRGYISQIGDIQANSLDLEQVEKNNFFWPEEKSLKDLKKLISNLKLTGDSIGAKITLLINNLPVGLGEPVFNKLNADLSHALMSINAIKGIEIGGGFSLVNKRGSEVRDEITPEGFKSNHSGGILGGISSGQPIIIHLACKPTSSISIPGNTIDKLKNLVKIKISGRHDPCIGIRAVPIAESMVAIVLMDHLLMWRAQCTDTVPIAPIR